MNNKDVPDVTGAVRPAMHRLTTLAAIGGCMLLATAMECVAQTSPTDPTPTDPTPTGIKIGAGVDMWSTNDATARLNIPAGFFDDDPNRTSLAVVDEDMDFTGGHLPSPVPSGIDTIVHRLNRVNISGTAVIGPGSVDPSDPQPSSSSGTTAIRVIGLNLTSLSQLQVHYNDSTSDWWWVEICLSDEEQPLGSMTITKTHGVGGTVSSTLRIRPRYVFTNGSTVLELDAGDPQYQLDDIVMTASGHWTSEVPDGWVVPELQNNWVVPQSCEFAYLGPNHPGTLPGTTGNFHAGVQAIPSGGGSYTYTTPPPGFNHQNDAADPDHKHNTRHPVCWWFFCHVVEPKDPVEPQH